MVTWIQNQSQWNICHINTTEGDPGYNKYKVPIGLLTTYSVKFVFKAKIQLESDFIQLPL